MADKPHAPSLSEIHMLQALVALRGALKEVLEQLPAETQSRIKRPGGDYAQSMEFIKKVIDRWPS